MTSTNNSKTGERKLTDFPKVRGTTYRKVAQGQLRELGMWVETDSPARWGRQHAGVYLAGAGCVGRINDKQQAEVQEWAIEAGLKLDLATNVLAATQAQAQIEVADKIRAAVNGVGVN